MNVVSVSWTDGKNEPAGWGGRGAVKGGENRKLQLVGDMVRNIVMPAFIIGASFLLPCNWINKEQSLHKTLIKYIVLPAFFMYTLP